MQYQTATGYGPGDHCIPGTHGYNRNMFCKLENGNPAQSAHCRSRFKTPHRGLLIDSTPTHLVVRPNNGSCACDRSGICARGNDSRLASATNRLWLGTRTVERDLRCVHSTPLSLRLSIGRDKADLFRRWDAVSAIFLGRRVAHCEQEIIRDPSTLGIRC